MNRWNIPVCCAILAALAGCASSNGNLYFLSTQKVGVEVAASDPASNASPKIVIGYESLKGAIVPVKNEDKTLRDQAYSVLGITGVSAAGSGTAGLAVSEWFATGLAAELLARQRFTPLALAGSKGLTAEMVAQANREQLALTFESVAATEKYLSLLTPRSTAQEAVLNDLTGLEKVAKGITFETFAADGTRANYAPSTGASGWSRVMEARADLKASIEHARRRSVNTALTPAERQTASDAYRVLSDLLEAFDRDILTSDAAQAAWSEMTSILETGG